jgi:hypothetical protein
MGGCGKRIFSWRRIQCKSSIWAIKRNCCDIVELQNTTERKELVFSNKKIKSGVIPSSIWIKVFINNTRKELDKFLKKNSLYPIIFFHSFLPPHNRDKTLTINDYEREGENPDFFTLQKIFYYYKGTGKNLYPFTEGEWNDFVRLVLLN